MKINCIRISYLAIPLKNPLVTAQLHRAASCNIILQIKFDNGLWGYGEATPRTYVTGESPQTVLEIISRYFLPILKAANFEQIIDVEEVVKKLNTYLEGKRDLFHGSALCAVELALLDGIGKLSGKPLQDIFGKPLRNTLEYSIGFPCVSPEELAAYFQIIKNYRGRYFKIKVGKLPENDIERIARIRSYFGNRAELRVDANCQWDLPAAIMMADKLEKLGVVAIEQPLAKNDIEGLKKLKKITPLKLIADESACSFNDVKRLIDEDACDLVNIKISKCGGLVNSLNIADYLYKNNKSCILGAHAAETGILESAGRIFGVLAPNVRYFEGSISSFLFEEAVVEGVEGFDENCLASTSSKPGLGIALKTDVINKFSACEVLIDT